ncbi:MAG: VWA domain-containing protein [Chloroflexota bacterium]
MTLLWPWLLLLLLLVPLIIAAYMWMLRRKRKFVIRYSSLSLIREAMPKRSKWRQHLPFALFLIGITCLILALARPAAAVEVPLSRTSIILALDISRSMCATDVEPNRLTIAQEAALAFIDDQVDGTQIGIVAFARFAEVVVPPTRDKERLREAIQSFRTSFGTVIGSATLKSIDAIAEVNPEVAPSGVVLDFDGDKPNPEIIGYLPDIVVLLTDGANSGGIPPLIAAEQAADRRVRVYTIGFGTDDPGAMVCTPEQTGPNNFGGFGGGGGNFGGGGFSGGGGGGWRRFVVIDEDTLKGIAEMTGGTYFRAENADQLLDIFLNLPTQVILQKENLEISVLFSGLGAVFIVSALFLSLRWNRFP